MHCKVHGCIKYSWKRYNKIIEQNIARVHLGKGHRQSTFRHKGKIHLQDNYMRLEPGTPVRGQPSNQGKTTQ